MLIRLDNNKEIDTDIFSSEERHILQKLIGWKSLVISMAEFQQKKESALSTGWNNSGPIQETEPLTLVIRQMEKELRIRLEKEHAGCS